MLKITSWAAGPWCSVTSAGGRDPHGPPALQGRQEEALLPHHLAQCKPFLPCGLSPLPVMLPGSSSPQNSGLTSSPGLCLASCLSHVAFPTPRCCSWSPGSSVLCEHPLDPAGLCRGRRWKWLRSVLGAGGAQGQDPQGDFWSSAPLEVISGLILQDPSYRRGRTALLELGDAQGS